MKCHSSNGKKWRAISRRDELKDSQVYGLICLDKCYKSADQGCSHSLDPSDHVTILWILQMKRYERTSKRWPSWVNLPPESFLFISSLYGRGKNGIWGWSCVKAEAVRLYCRLWLTIIMAWTLTDNTDTGSPSLLDARWIFLFQTSLKTHTFYPNIERIEMLIIWFCLPHW